MARKVAWLTGLYQAGSSHHTRPAASSAHPVCPDCAALVEQVGELMHRITRLEARLLAQVASCAEKGLDEGTGEMPTAQQYMNRAYSIKQEIPE